MHHAAKAMLKGKFIVLSAYIGKGEKSEVFDGKIPCKVLASQMQQCTNSYSGSRGSRKGLCGDRTLPFGLC